MHTAHTQVCIRPEYILCFSAAVKTWPSLRVVVVWNEEHCQRLCQHKATAEWCITSVDSVTEEQLLTSPTRPAVANVSCKQLTKTDIHPCLNYVCQFLQLIITAITFIRPKYLLKRFKTSQQTTETAHTQVIRILQKGKITALFPPLYLERLQL